MPAVLGLWAYISGKSLMPMNGFCGEQELVMEMALMYYFIISESQILNID